MSLKIIVFVTIWTVISGEQEETCPEPGVSPDGSRRGDCCSVGDVLAYSCRGKYQLIGDRLITCLPGGTWSSPRPRCRPLTGICPDPPTIKNGRLRSGHKTEDYYPTYEEVEIVCDPGFVFYGETKHVFCKENFQWDVAFGKCEEMFCDDPGTPENGKRDSNNLSAYSRITFSCSPGYRIIGSAERYCLPNKQWSGVQARCNLKYTHCPSPGIPANGKRNGNSFKEWDQVVFTCDEGFELVGSNISWCLPDETWSGERVVCSGAHDFDKDNDACDKLKKEGSTDKPTVDTRIYPQENRTHVSTGPLKLNHPGRLILYFLFDVSGSIREHNFNTSIKFAKALVEKVGVYKDGTRVAAVTFSFRTNIQFLPFHYSTTNEVLEGLDKIKYTKGGSAINSAMQLVREQIIPLSIEYFGNKPLKHIIFIMTDGRVNRGGNPKAQTDLLKTRGVEIYCIGITDRVKQDMLHDIASIPRNQHVFMLNRYPVLDWLIQELIDGIIDYSQCGLSARKIRKPRMIGGKAAIEPWPWMAALYFKEDKSISSPQFTCGGSIIGRTWILTAAHCLVQLGKIRRTTDTIIKLGLTDIENGTLLQEFDAEKFLIHPAYKESIFDYNIALIKLNRPIEYNRYVRPVCLPPKELSPSSNLYKPREEAFAIGWGYDQPVDIGRQIKPVNVLKEVMFPLQERNTCLQSILDNDLPEKMFTERMLCAGKGDGSEDTCAGDSGGALMQELINEKGDIYWTQIGIISWGLGCGLPNTYGFYTHVQNLMSWIYTELTVKEF